MSRRRIAASLLALGSLSSAGAVELQAGQPLAIDLPASSFTRSVFIDVPAGAERLTIELDAGNAAQNVDLLARFDRAFPASAGNGTPEPLFLADQSHFLSASSGGSERIVISRSSRQPLREGTLHLALLNFSSSAAPVTLRASYGSADDYLPIEVLFDDTSDGCDVAGWNDSTAKAPVRGNTGTTLGQQRRLALIEAARLLSAELQPNAVIRVQACWETLEYTANGGGTLAHAGPTYLFINDGSLEQRLPTLDARHVAQTGAVAAHQSGTETCRLGVSRSGAQDSCANPVPDVQAAFNYKVDQVKSFDYGFTGTSPGESSFVSTAMHEIAHGLGFLALLDLSTNVGRQHAFINGQPYDDAYGRHVRWASAFPQRDEELLRLPEQDRVTAVTSLSYLRFSGSNSLASQANPFRTFPAPDSYVQLHAPASIVPGSTLSHLSSVPTPGQLMNASISASAPRTLGLALDVLRDVGWDPAPKATPAAPQLLQGQYFDPARNGHGFDIRRVDGIPGVDNLYFLVLYTYDASGRPEFYSAVGEIIDGIFMPARDSASGDSLLRSLYDAERSPPTYTDTSPTFDGQVRIDFVDGARHPVCQDGAGGRPLDGTTAVMHWELAGEERQWCMQPILPVVENVEIDFGSHWYVPADPGWGVSIMSFPAGGNDGIGLQLYFPDATGRGRWALMNTTNFVPGEVYPLYEVGGYCRDCDKPDGELQLTTIGTISLDLRAPDEGTSTVSFDVSYPGPEGGRFVRTDAPIEPASTPAYRGE